MGKNLEVATFGGGCFWCTEAIFKRLKGVESVMSGYSGGKRENPMYEHVTTGATGHAESIEIKFDPNIISFKDLLKVFFATHDPTTKDRQGNDMGTQYRSVIFYHDDSQREEAEKYIEEMEREKAYENPIVTEVSPFENFYKAEDYHQNYYDNNKSYPYCSVVIGPKIKKLMEKFGEKVKDNYK